VVLQDSVFAVKDGAMVLLCLGPVTGLPLCIQVVSRVPRG
jgi:hypothetical protein